MLPSPSSALIAGLESVLIAAGFLGFGYLLVDALTGRSLDPVLRWGLALPAVAAYTVVLMLLHMATGGRVLRAGWIPELLTFGVAVALIAWKVVRVRRGQGEEGNNRRDLLVAGICVIVAMALWGTPVFRLLPLSYGGDVPWNMGFATQLLNGETTPSARIIGDVPNYYPWLYHALTALLAHFTPGGRAFHAMGPLHLLLVAGSILSLFALGREITRSWIGGAAAALFGGMAGGIGFVMLRHLDVVMNPRANDALQYLGDLQHKRSYNVAFTNVAPAFPRDVALTMLLAFLLLLVVGLSHRSRPLLVGAGIALGMAGLAGAESFLVGMGVAAVTAVLSPGLGRLRTAVSLIVPALAVYAIWLVPLAVSYFRLGGFRSITQVGPVDLPLWAILGAWGIVTPIAAYGFSRSLPRIGESGGTRVLLVLLAASGFALIASALVTRLFGEAFDTLGRRHRYWPLLHLAMALFAAVGAYELLQWSARQLGRIPAVGISVLMLGLALPSPVVASLALANRTPGPPVLRATLRGDTHTILSVIAPSPGLRCNAAIPEELARTKSVFSYTGYRLITLSRRVRWRAFYEEATARRDRKAAGDLLTSGSADVDEWMAVARTFEVDLVVGDPSAAMTPAFQAVRTTWGSDEGRRYVAAWVGPCDG
jgi:hypothetical protein